jgi:hypothetical protein
LTEAVARFQPEELLRVLERHAVRYVLVGGLAATLHGSPLRTGDADICPAREAENLDRLAAALREMNARIRTADAPEGVAFACDAWFLSQVTLLNLTTAFGDLDLAFQPAGTQGYEDLRQRSEQYDLGGLVVPTAALEDVIRSKQAAGRAKDHAALPTLRTLLAMRRPRA